MQEPSRSLATDSVTRLACFCSSTILRTDLLTLCLVNQDELLLIVHTQCCWTFYRIEKAIKDLNNISYPDEKRLYSNIEESYIANRNLHKASIDNAVDWLESLKGDLEIKQGKPFEPVEIVTKCPSGIILSVDSMNSVIDEHNKTTDKDFNLESGIVVIDDPISSLDSNSIYSAFSFMQDRTKNAGQFFIMTHNFSLFKEVRRWFCDQKNKPKQGHSLYMLKDELDGKKRIAKISELDPLLRDFNSEYHFLFSTVYNSQTEARLSKLYHIPNIVRKMLEEFFSFKNPTIDSLESKIKNVCQDDTKVRKVIRFVSSYSHADKIGDTEDLSLFQELPSVVKDIMELIRVADESHFKKMESIVRGEQ